MPEVAEEHRRRLAIASYGSLYERIRSGRWGLPFVAHSVQNAAMSERERHAWRPASPEATGAVLRACNRSAALAYLELKQGVDTLASIATIAPLLGLFATVTGIANSFVGAGTEKSTLMAAIALLLSEAIWPTAIGIAIGVMACFFYNYLADRLDNLRTEMHAAGLVLANELSRYRGPWQLGTAAPEHARGAPATSHASCMNFDVGVVCRVMVCRYGYRWVLPAAQAVISGTLVMADRVLPEVNIRDVYSPVLVPFSTAVGEVMNAPAYWIAGNLAYLFGVRTLVTIIAALAFSALFWYLLGVWLDNRSGIQPARTLRHRAVHWSLLLLATSLCVITFIDVTGGFFSRASWAPVVALSRWAWMSLFVYTQIAALRREPDTSKLPSLFRQ